MRIAIVFILVSFTVFCFGQIDHLVRYDFRCQSQIDSFSIKYPVCNSIGVVVVSDTVGDIVDVSPLKQIKKVREFWIRKNPKLKSVELFNDVALDSIDNFYVSENDVLDTLIVLKQTKVMVYGFEIYNDKSLYIEGLHHIDSIYQWNITLPQEGVSKIKGFDNLRKGGFLASLSGSIHIEGFNKFKKISNLSISNNSLLADLTQFSSLEEVKSLSLANIKTNFKLNGLENLKTLRSLGLLDIDTLENLKPIGQVRGLNRLTIYNTAVNLHLKELGHVNEINTLGLFKINGAIVFDSVTFDSIKQLIFIENDGLKDCNFSMNYLPQSFNKLNLNYAGSPLYTYREYNGNSLVLAKNPNLDFCNSKAVCDLIASIPESNIAIEFNGENCSQLEAVVATCIVSSDEQKEQQLLWYPNPVTEQLSLGKKMSRVEVFDMTGRKIHTVSNTENLNTSSWLNGVYLIRVYDGENIFVQEQMIVKN
ncbi:MAG: T9SS type A sorting domain-containing protein [Saprospiraceae bacterium]|nr:T9SS type A sorting domain-containing protein [Saprospiraceae bacterium]